MQKYLDSHCHLPENEPFGAAFARANNAGIVGCVINSVTEHDWEQIEQIARDNKNVIGCIGVHPWNVDDVSANWMSRMDATLSRNPNLLVGEVGLDKTRDNFAAQERVFISALELAIKHKRTINIHCVHAWDDMLRILKSYRRELPKIIAHSFDGTQNALDLDAELYFSYSPNVANMNYRRMRESVPRVPKNKILVESDDPDLTATITAANGVLSLRDDITADDIFNNATWVFFNG